MADYPPCPLRKKLVLFRADGKKDYVQRCTEQSAEMANQDVSPEDCIACSIRASLVRDAKFRPLSPRPPAKQSDVLTPDTGGDGFAPCSQRLKITVTPSCASCSKRVTHRVCDCDLVTHFGGIVTPEICAECPERS